MQKNYILDTNILIQSPNAIFGFEDNTVILTGTTLQELDGLKNAPGETGYNARESIRVINSLRDDGDYQKGILLQNGGTFRIEPDGCNKDNLPEGFSIDKPDNRIISAAITIMNENDKVDTILVTNDVSMQINATIAGLTVQNYWNTSVREKERYTGKAELTVPHALVQKIYDKRVLAKNKLDKYIKNPEENQYFILHSDMDEHMVAMVRYANEEYHELDKNKQSPFKITAKNHTQRLALDALMAPADEIPLVILTGPAGTAKTFLSMAAGLDKTYDRKKNKTYTKIMISRTNTLSDNALGFLPGDLEEKMNPLIAPFMDNLEILLRGNTQESEEQIQYQIEDMKLTGVLEICSIAYMRGRSLNNVFLIIDEAQNATPGQILEIVSRAGMGCKIVLCGDPEQIDEPKLSKDNNGLVFAANRMKGSKLCAQIAFSHEETVRSPLAMEAAERLKAR